MCIEFLKSYLNKFYERTDDGLSMTSKGSCWLFLASGFSLGLTCVVVLGFALRIQNKAKITKRANNENRNDTFLLMMNNTDIIKKLQTNSFIENNEILQIKRNLSEKNN